ncbi:MAG: hypothetical protein ABW252_07105 [Polyangiales bacterium]
MRIVQHAILSVSLFSLSLASLTPAAQAQDKGENAACAPDKGKDKDKDKKHCDDLQGTFSSVAVANCPDSPIGLCTQGVLEGDLDGDYYFVFETMVPHPTDPTKLAYTGYSVITTQQGIIYTDDTGVVDAAAPTDPADLITEAEIVDGTKKYKKKTGAFVASGVLQFGAAEGTYDATICKEKDKR